MPLDNSRGAMPMYLQIKEYIKNKIVSNEYEVGDLIPTEPQFQEQFGVSRTTVRQAINELQIEGYVDRFRGKGTVVTHSSKLVEKMSNIRSFTDEIIDRGGVPSTLSVDISIVKASKEISRFFEIEPDSMVLCVERVRAADGIPIVVFETYLELSSELPIAESSYFESLYQLIFEKTGRSVSKVEERFEAILARGVVPEKLNVTDNSPILLRTRYSFDQNKRPLEVTRSYYNGNLYSYSIDLFSE